mgnify:CR=1 FL=1
MVKHHTLSRCRSAIWIMQSTSIAPGKAGKIEILKKNPWVCFEAAVKTELINADEPYKYNVRYRSVIGYGKVKFLEDYNEKVEGLTVLSEHYGI